MDGQTPAVVRSCGRLLAPLYRRRGKEETMSIRRLRSLAVLAATCIALSLVMSSSVSAATFRVRGVTDNGGRWRPRSISIPVGSKVVWKMVEGSHNVTATSNNWNKSTNLLGPGSRTSFTFRRGGTYRYRCTFHSTFSNGNCSGMCGRVVVG
jgi:plastocyanin